MYLFRKEAYKKDGDETFFDMYNSKYRTCQNTKDYVGEVSLMRWEWLLKKTSKLASIQMSINVLCQNYIELKFVEE